MTAHQRAIDAAFTKLIAAIDAESEAEYRQLVATHRFEAWLRKTGCGEPFGGDPHPRTRALFQCCRAKDGLHFELIRLHDRWLEGLARDISN